MSIVTSLIIIFPYSENESERIKEINNFEHDGKKYCFTWIDDPKSEFQYSGNKKFNSVVLLGSFSNFPTTTFLEFLARGINWEDPKYVQVMINDEKSNDRTFSVFSDAGNVINCPSLKW